MNPELLRPQSEKISRIFFSATVKDCKGYRNEVKDAIVHRIPGTTVHLQEHWVGAWNDVVDRCLRELNDSHAYFGLFGFRYGWVPKGQGCSITELEFKAACDKWRGPSADAPIFIFLPDDCSKKEPSKAAIDLLALAEQVLDEEFGADERKKQRSRRSQDRLRKRVSSGQTVNWFRDSQHLREQAITCVLNYNTTILESALRAATEARGARRPGPTRIPDEELGIIGREPQLNALEEALGQVRMATDVPGACILVHGLENSGHRQFAAFL